VSFLNSVPEPKHTLEFLKLILEEQAKASSVPKNHSRYYDNGYCDYGKDRLPQTHEEADIANRQADYKHRDAWIKFVKYYTLGITFCIFVVVFLCLISKVELSGEIQGVKYSCKVASFHLSDNVLIALLTTTLANVLGMCFIGLKYYFPSSASDTKPNDKT
jgi:hypothetical protein